MITNSHLEWVLKQEKLAKYHEKVKKSLKLSKKMRKNGKKPSETLAASNNTCERFCYHMSNKTEGLPGLLMRKEGDAEAIDREINEAYDWTGVVKQFHKEVLGINSYDNAGGNILSSCHFGEGYDNGFWNGTQLVLGDGHVFYPLTRDLTVIAHELGHSVVQYTANLNYYSQSGAMNESYADVFGVTCKQWYLKQTSLQADWLIGPDICRPEFGKALRSFKDEKAFPGDDQPSTFKNYNRSLADQQQVHCNSKIPNHAFYLFCINASALGSLNAYEAPLQVWFKSLLKLSKYSKFRNLKKATLEVCLKDYPNLVPALESAWKSVNL